MELTDLLFAYGAEMNRETLRARCGGGEMISAAFLSGCRIAFFGHDPIWDSGMETLLADDNAGVWGVLYRLTVSAWEKLDTYKGATLDGAGNYFHYPVEVVTSGGGSCLVRTYKKNTRGTPHCPSSEYVALLLKGAAENGLPLGYQDFLRAIPSEPAKYVVPRTDGKKRGSLVVLSGGAG
jgi:gamma-glutamylcyclotransferase (GGCT)/AIG2-like uncharacterized protein YtfP